MCARLRLFPDSLAFYVVSKLTASRGLLVYIMIKVWPQAHRLQSTKQMMLIMYSVLCFLLVLVHPFVSALLSSSPLAPSINHASVLKHRDILLVVVTWDRSSIMIDGERLMLLSAEFHPWRLPSPGLWLDIFQKVKALGFSGVSFYLNWALLEGEPGCT